MHGQTPEAKCSRVKSYTCSFSFMCFRLLLSIKAYHVNQTTPFKPKAQHIRCALCTVNNHSSSTYLVNTISSVHTPSQNLPSNHHIHHTPHRRWLGRRKVHMRPKPRRRLLLLPRLALLSTPTDTRPGSLRPILLPQHPLHPEPQPQRLDRRLLVVLLIPLPLLAPGSLPAAPPPAKAQPAAAESEAEPALGGGGRRRGRRRLARAIGGRGGRGDEVTQGREQRVVAGGAAVRSGRGGGGAGAAERL